MLEVRKADPSMFDAVHELLLDFNHPTMSKDDWRRMLFDYPWPCAESHRGYVLVDDGAVVGFLGTIFSTRVLGNGEPASFCNLSSWIVRPEHRSSGLKLVMPVLAQRKHTIVNLTPSETAAEIFRSLGFQPLDDRVLYLPPVSGVGDLLRSVRGSVVLDPDEIRSALPDAQRRIFDDHRGTIMARHALIRRGGRQCYIVATETRRKGLRGAHVHYLSDPELFWEHTWLAKWALFRALGAVFLMIDGRLAEGRTPVGALVKHLGTPRLYRPASPAIRPQDVDSLYSELQGLRA